VLAREETRQRGSARERSVRCSGMRTGHPTPGRSALSKGRDPLLLDGRVVLGAARPPVRPAGRARRGGASRSQPGDSTPAKPAIVLRTAATTSADEGEKSDDVDGTATASR
jgi:hypothetical protein